ncbi:MAG: thioesterase family protein [Acidimicrobiia bacterium]
MADSYFTTDDGHWFTPTELARGPWDVDGCHAGPPTGLMVRAMERLLPGQPLVRFTVELMRPIPMSGFVVQAEIRRPGRQVGLTEAEILGEEHVYARAFGVHVRELPLDVPTVDVATPVFADSVPGPFPIQETTHGLTMFADSIECRYDPRYSVGEGGETLIWLRPRVPLLADEEPSPAQRICPLADSGNGISWNAYLDEVQFINPDLTVWLHRPPVGEWHASHTRSHWQPTGIGAAEAALFDTEGPVGGAVQTLLLFPPG